MQTFSLFLDIFVVIATVVAYFTRPRFGGELVKGLQKIMIGILLLGFSHLTEILFPYILVDLNPILNDVIHGLLEACALVFMIVGLARMRTAFEM